MTPFYSGKLFITQHKNVIEYSYNLCSPILGKSKAEQAHRKTKKKLK
jgi:hypothetical protein